MANFFLEYLKNPSRIGAVAPSGKGLANKMMEPIDFDRAETIVEYGPGTGAFTGLLCSRKRPETRLVLIERNDTFFKEVSEKFGTVENVTVLHGSAEDADKLLGDLGCHRADYVVSGLPFTSLPREVSLRVFEATKKLIGAEGRFVTFQYTLVKEKFFKEHFDFAARLFEWKNLPPAYVFVLKNRA